MSVTKLEQLERTEEQEEVNVAVASKNSVKKKLNWRHRDLLERDRNLKRWYDNIYNRSDEEANILLSCLSRFCRDYAKMYPSQFVSMGIIQMEDLTLDYVQHMQSAISQRTGKPYAPSYIESYVKAISSWARWNRKKFVRKIDIKDAGSFPIAEGEETPSTDNLRSVLYSATTPLRTRVMISITSFSGVRLQVHGNSRGLDGLNVGDFFEMEIVQENGIQRQVRFPLVPTAFQVRKSISKSRHRYITFLCEEGCQILKEYLDWRIRNGEILRADSPIIATTREDEQRIRRMRKMNQVNDRPFITTRKVSQSMREAMRTIGLTQRPYIWRSYFDTFAMMRAEGKGIGVIHAYSQFWMGHAGDIERKYTLDKKNLPKEILEEMREAYRKAQSLFQTRLPPEDIVTEEKAKAIGKTTWLKGIGFTDKEITDGQLLNKDEPELSEAVRRKLLGDAMQRIVVTTSEMAQHLDKYKPIFETKDGKVVMELVA